MRPGSVLPHGAALPERRLPLIRRRFKASNSAPRLGQGGCRFRLLQPSGYALMCFSVRLTFLRTKGFTPRESSERNG